jgi:hypothetical protein
MCNLALSPLCPSRRQDPIVHSAQLKKSTANSQPINETIADQDQSPYISGAFLNVIKLRLLRIASRSLKKRKVAGDFPAFPGANPVC